MHQVLYFTVVFQMRSAYWGYIQYIAVSGAHKYVRKKTRPGAVNSVRWPSGWAEYLCFRRAPRPRDRALVPHRAQASGIQTCSAPAELLPALLLHSVAVPGVFFVARGQFAVIGVFTILHIFIVTVSHGYLGHPVSGNVNFRPVTVFDVSNCPLCDLSVEMIRYEGGKSVAAPVSDTLSSTHSRQMEARTFRRCDAT